MDEDRRENDLKILTELAHMRAVMEGYMAVTTATVERHERLLYGESGRNGIQGTVNRHKTFFQWAGLGIGVIFTCVVGAVVAVVS